MADGDEMWSRDPGSSTEPDGVPARRDESPGWVSIPVTRTMTPPPPPTPTADPGPAEPAGAGPETPSAPRKSGARHALLGAVVGGLVGALVASGVFVAFDDGSSVQSLGSSSTAAVSRPSSEIDDSGGVAAIISKAEPAIVSVVTGSGPGTGQGGAGTGFVISSDGYIATNNHVVEGARTIHVTFTNGQEASATIVGRDPSFDLAVLKVSRTGLPTIEVGEGDHVQVGDEVVAIGNALALEGGLTVTRGIISSLERSVDTETGVTLEHMLQTDAAINPGNSGGPLLDAKGRAIGINTAIADPSVAQNIGFAIPLSTATRSIIDDLRSGRKPAFLGVSTQDVTSALANQLDLSVQKGAYVARVTADAPASKAGIKVGDVIVEIDGKEITTAADVTTAIRQHRPGDEVKVVVSRNGSRQTVSPKLAERPDSL